ncbi:hypothetical protein AN191_13610 [Loktanella sp. 5RATIMAR09]|nr:hypothetical protein AN191_13610 [Loktanella sp. 5RATIMAR09]
MQQLSDNFAKVLHEVCPDAIRPDEVGNSSSSGKAPDHFLPTDRIAIERKTISVDLSAGKTNGEMLQSAKQEDFIVFGTVHVELNPSEHGRLANMMTGMLKQRISDAEKQLAEFHSNDDVLTVCCVFTEISTQSTLSWEKKNLPTRDMVRACAAAAFKKRSIDALVLFTVDGSRAFSLDIFQTVYADQHLQSEFNCLERIVRKVSRSLPIRPDYNVVPCVIVEQATPEAEKP